MSVLRLADMMPRTDTGFYVSSQSKRQLEQHRRQLGWNISISVQRTRRIPRLTSASLAREMFQCRQLPKITFCTLN